MPNHFKDERNPERGEPASSPVKPESRAAARARAEAEEREKREWIARRKREEKAAAEAEAREKAAWIAQRKREEKAAAEAEAREKAAWIAQRKREEQEAAEAEAREKAAWIAERKRREREQLRDEERAADNAERRAKAAEAAARKRRAEKRAARTRRFVHKLKIALLVIMLLVVAVGGGWLVLNHKLAENQTSLPKILEEAIPLGEKPAEETPTEKPVVAGWEDPTLRFLQVELPFGVSMELDRAEAGLIKKGEEADAGFQYGPGDQGAAYLRQKVDEAMAQLGEKTAGEPFTLDQEARVLCLVKGAGELSMDREKLYAALEEALLGRETEFVFSEMEGEISPPDFSKLYQEVYVEPVNASFSGSDFKVIPGTAGLDFDVEQARRLWQAADPMEEVRIPLRPVRPKITAEALADSLFRDCLGSQTTLYGGSTPARVNNINLAVSKINGTVLMPGETFSYNHTVGERTMDNGFELAAAYASGEVVQEVGGGVCQVSSTLYCASLYARMTILSRTYHYFRVTYLDPGMDATVSWEKPDYIFRNDRDFPVKIVAYCDNDEMKLTIEIWGTDTDGIWVSLSYDQYLVHDTEYPEVVIGSNVYLFITYHAPDGSVIETVEGFASTYHRHDYEIDWPPEKYAKDKEEEGGGSDGEVIIDDGGGGGGGEGGGDDGGGGGGDEGGGGDAVIEP